MTKKQLNRYTLKLPGDTVVEFLHLVERNWVRPWVHDRP